MTIKPTVPSPTRSGDYLDRWDPENPAFWEAQGKKRAWASLTVTTASLLFAFATWFMVSALVVKLPNIGFQLTTGQLFWLAAMPGLAAGTLRIMHTFLIPMFGSRKVVSVSTALLLLPAIGWGLAVQNPETPFAVLMLLAFLAGLGGGNFSSFMPATSLYFPKKLQGTALGIQAGIGNFGVSLTQFVTPWIIGVGFAGGMLGSAQNFVKGEQRSLIYLQNAALWYVPLIVVCAVLAYVVLRSVPVRATWREQADIYRDKHNWIMTSLYMATFGTFSGLAAAFPLLIGKLYGKLDGAPDPLMFAFLGPLVGSLVRVVFGGVADKVGGAKLTTISVVGMMISAIAVTFFTTPTSMSEFPFFVASMLGIFFFAGIGNASTFKQIPGIFPPRQAGGVIGWTAAIAAYGPFIVSVLIGAVLGAFGNPNAFFLGAAAFYAVNAVLNWYFYARKGAERPC